uniref:Glucagon-like peptide 2 receptor n=1 Tax=Neogobius melanostomus TaxID=47308 RepID=A0A8C6U6L8_9GOBI
MTGLPHSPTRLHLVTAPPCFLFAPPCLWETVSGVPVSGAFDASELWLKLFTLQGLPIMQHSLTRCAIVLFRIFNATANHPHPSLDLCLDAILSRSLVGGSLLESLISKRTEYRDNCSRTLAHTALSFSGVFCNGSFDTFVCWPHSAPGNVSIPCPSYLPWIQQDSSRQAHRECLEDGTWRRKQNSTDLWRDDSECQERHFFKEKVRTKHVSALRVISVIGYSLSLASLSLATLLMGMLRKLHCTRNYIHMNLFVSFILRAAAVICKELIMHLMYSQLPQDDQGWSSYASSTVSRVCMEYCIFSNYLWLLVEAMFLHKLLFSAVLTRGRLLKSYMLLGWGTAPVFILTTNHRSSLYQIIMNLHPQIIFFIFIKILMLLLSKLKADQVTFSDYRYSLARATLVLIPLLGIHEVVFTVLVDECVEGSSRYVRNFINLTLSSFQHKSILHFVLSLLKVQAELKKRWQLFLFTHHVTLRSCVRGTQLKQLWKSTHGRRPHCSAHNSESCEEGGYLGSLRPQLLQAALKSVAPGSSHRGQQARGQETLTRKSLSSSDGDMTMGETMEEVLEESHF